MVWLGLWMFFFYTYFLSSSLLSNKCQKYHIKIGCGGDNKIHRIISNFMYGNTVCLPLSIGPICALGNIQRFASYFTLLLLLQRRCTTYEEDVFDCINWCIVSLGGGWVGGFYYLWPTIFWFCKWNGGFLGDGFLRRKGMGSLWGSKEFWRVEIIMDVINITDMMMEG